MLTITIGSCLLVGGVLLGLGLARLVTHLPRAAAASRSGQRIVPSLIPAASALRLGLAGVALVVLGLGWLAEVSWLRNFAIVFGLEELYETTAVVGLLRWAERQPSAAPALLSAMPARAFAARALPGAWPSPWRTARWV